MKIIAFYLPQFHSIPENDKWWGKGFTEWTNVKSAVPYFQGHYQPREPINDNYYDLLEEGVMENQMKLAKKYGIGGFCFYHYWFCGKKLLEKPVEKLLINSDASLPFCLAWANEPWTRAWNGKQGEKEVIQIQNYGEEPEWVEHFNYLLPFFKDHRYICVDEKPVFLIYRSYNILKCDSMLKLWSQMAIENGLKGIYFITMETGYESDNRHKMFDAKVDFEPMRTLKEFDDKWTMHRNKRIANLEIFSNIPFIFKFFMDKLSYDDCYDIITHRNHKNTKEKTYFGAFVNWDNTPRKGKKGLVFEGGTPSKFKKYLKSQIQRSKQYGNELLFINAWNEWSEGAYLEPDKKYGYAYLNAVRNAIKETK